MRRLTVLPLPDRAYVPGTTARAETGIHFEVAARAPAVTDPRAWRQNEAWLYGLELLDAGFFWEAHEVLEPVWMHAAPNSAGRAAVRGVIQLANACLKLAMRRQGAAQRLLAMARADLRDSGPDPVMGLDTAALAEAVEAFRVAVEDGAADSVDLKPSVLAHLGPSSP